MKKIIGVLRPFQYTQNFYVYEDGNRIDSASPTIDEAYNVIFSFLDKYKDIHQIDLSGPKQYSKVFKKQIQELEILKYNKNILEINIIY